jgi:hypothetical protein
MRGQEQLPDLGRRLKAYVSLLARSYPLVSVPTDAPTFPCLNVPGRLLNLRKLPYSSPIAQRAA